MTTDHFRYRAFMEFAYTLKYLYLVSVSGSVRLTGSVWEATEYEELGER